MRCIVSLIGGLGLAPVARGLGDGAERLTEEIGKQSAVAMRQALIAEVYMSELLRDPFGRWKGRRRDSN